MTEKKSRRRTFDLSRLTAVPYFVWMALFTIVPLALVVWYAFIDYPGTSFTISNFTGVVKYAKTFVKSINLSLISTVICLLIGFPMGFIMDDAP